MRLLLQSSHSFSPSGVIMEKLYVVVRNDLAPGLQVAQVCHAVREFAHRFPELDRQWFEQSNNLVVLQVPTLEDLEKLVVDGGVIAPFHEPDLNGELTAAAFAAGRTLSSLPLALWAA
jgi:peptidyl-tRNA hydrolase